MMENQKGHHLCKVPRNPRTEATAGEKPVRWDFNHKPTSDLANGKLYHYGKIANYNYTIYPVLFNHDDFSNM